MPCKEFVKDDTVVCSIKITKTTSSCHPFVICIYTCINGLHNHQAFAYKTGLEAYTAFKKYIAVLCKGVDYLKMQSSAKGVGYSFTGVGYHCNLKKGATI